MRFLNDIVNKFNDEGYALFEVGGYVRDSLLGIESKDIDLTTDALPEEIKRIVLQDMNVTSIYTIGEEYGTIGITTDDGIIEITTYRDEVYPADSRKPKVTFGDSIFQDLARRDFTINAIARIPKNDNLIDPFNGLKDIKNKVIRCVGDNERFNEDPLRMMRAVRFAAQLGFTLDIKITNPERLKIISKERIRDELSKILLTDRPVFGIRKLVEYGLMEYIIPDFMKLQDLAQGDYHIKDAFNHSLLVLGKAAKYNFGEDNLIFRLAALLHDIGKPETMTVDGDVIHFYSHQYVGAHKVREVLSDLRYDNTIIERVGELVYHHMSPLMLYKGYEEGGLSKRSITRLIRKIGERDIFLLLALVKSDMRSHKSSREEFLKVLTILIKEAMAEEPLKINSPLDGNEIMELLQFKPGPLIGEMKKYLTDLVIDGELEQGDKNGAIICINKYYINMFKTTLHVFDEELV